MPFHEVNAKSFYIVDMDEDKDVVIVEEEKFQYYGAYHDYISKFSKN